MNLELKKWTLDDKSILAKICNETDEQFMPGETGHLFTDNEALCWIDMAQKQEGIGGIFRAIIVDNEYVGNISVEKNNDLSYKDAEIGYFLLNEKCSNGIMTIAVNKICEIAFDILDIVRITGIVYSQNLASKRVLEKNDFVLEGIMKNAILKNDTLYDMCIYGKYLDFI